MTGHWKLKLASILFQHVYFLYKPLYFRYKNKKDRNHLHLIQKFVSPGSIILDIGSNIGFYASFLSDVAGANGHVYCFEPDPDNFKHLNNEVGNRPNVSLIQKAVASDSGSLHLFRSKLLNVDHRTYETESFNQKISVEKISIDDYVNGRFSVHFIKMDIQGYEMEALKGMKKTLEKNKDVLLLMELWPLGLKQAGSSAAEVFDYLTLLGFHIYRVSEAKISEFKKAEIETLQTGFFDDVNILATRSDLHLKPYST